MRAKRIWKPGCRNLGRSRMNAPQPRISGLNFQAEFNQKKARKGKRLKDRLARLASATGSSCPLCGQPLG